MIEKWVHVVRCSVARGPDDIFAAVDFEVTRMPLDVFQAERLEWLRDGWMQLDAIGAVVFEVVVMLQKMRGLDEV